MYCMEEAKGRKAVLIASGVTMKSKQNTLFLFQFFAAIKSIFRDKIRTEREKKKKMLELTPSKTLQP